MNSLEQLQKKYKELELEINRLKDINRTLNQTFVNSQVALEIFDSSGKLIDCNPACLEIFGIKDISQIKDYNLFTDYRIETQKLEKIKKGEVVRYELIFDFDKINQYNIYKTKKTGVYIFDCSIIPISKKNGYLVFLIDITKPKEIERNLHITNSIYKEKEEILRSIIESTNDLIWTVDPIEFKIQSFNSAVYNYFLKEINVTVQIGDTADKFTPKHKKWTGYYKKTIEQGHIEFVYKMTKGDYTMFYSLNAMYKDGELFGISVFGKDITEQTELKKEIFEKNKLLKEKNKILIKNEKLFRRLVESSIIGIMIFDSQSILFVNKNLCKIAGFSKKEFENKLPHDFVHPDDREHFISELEIRKRGENFNDDIYLRGISKRGNIIDMLVLCSTIIIDDQIIYIANIIDISKRKQETMELFIAKEKAEASDKLIVSFLRNISHEIKTPLNAINGFSQLIVDSVKGNEDLEKYSNLITENSKQLIEIVNDVIDVSNIYSDDFSLDFNEFNCSEIIYEIKSLYQKLANEKGLILTSRTDISSEDLIINSDKQKIKKILSHLISNSIKFTKTGEINLYTTIKDKKLIITVSDTGIGISEENLKIIFEPFRQIDSGVNRMQGGNGVGLFIVKSIIDLLKGSFDIKTKLGEGTTITITIPIGK